MARHSTSHFLKKSQSYRYLVLQIGYDKHGKVWIQKGWDEWKPVTGLMDMMESGASKDMIEIVGKWLLEAASLSGSKESGSNQAPARIDPLP